MSLVLTEEQEQFRAVVRSFLRSKSGEADVRRLMETEAGYDQAVWRQMADQLALQGLIVPEEHGGSGFTFAELAIVMEEAGRSLLCAPYFSTAVLATNTLLLADDEAARKEFLPAIASGDCIATLALAEDGGTWDETGIGVTASGSAGGYRLSGAKMFVLDGVIADLILVPARTEAGVSLFAVDGDAPGMTRALLKTFDRTRKQARLGFEDTPARLIGSEGGGWPVLERVLDLAAVALAAEQVGGAQACLDVAVQYAKDRVQFGRAIGSFQAIKHRCADLLLEVEAARSAAAYAAWCAAQLNDELPAVASLAKAYCSEAYFHVAAENIQIHGGIGFTWEHPAHLYYRRAKSSELFLGDPAYHRELLVRRIGL